MFVHFLLFQLTTNKCDILLTRKKKCDILRVDSTTSQQTRGANPRQSPPARMVACMITEIACNIFFTFN
jgi:hypothetical protein